ncbi:MAG: hypothetical protein P4L40_06495 [Terracidiphilus sp.]|nr:hypothetical protein [Terracidiphilus sp.]
MACSGADAAMLCVCVFVCVCVCMPVPVLFCENMYAESVSLV